MKLDVKKRFRDVKNYVLTHEKEIKGEAIKFGYCAIGVAVGYYASSKYNDLLFSKGLMIFHNHGIIRFFNPVTQNEVDGEEAVKVMRAFIASN